MTLEEAKQEIPDFKSFCKLACNNCTSNDWYCPTLCITLKNAYRLNYEDILKCYARNDGDMTKVFRYIKRK